MDVHKIMVLFVYYALYKGMQALLFLLPREKVMKCDSVTRSKVT